jgi:hypothetical protein
MRLCLQALTKLATELRDQYIVTYKSTNERYERQFRRIEDKLAEAREGMNVHNRSSYSTVANSPR